MKNLKLILALCFAMVVKTKAQFYGQQFYNFTVQNMIVSSAKVTNIHSSGFLTGVYDDANVLGKPFYVRKTDIQGGFSSADDFWMYYKVYKDLSCTTYNTNVDNCYGVSVIETGNSSTPTTGSRYALSAVCSSPAGGFFVVFATLDQSGFVVNKSYYDLPSTVTNAVKPTIVESQSSPGNYYICGSYKVSTTSPVTVHAYAMKVTVTGSVIWSKTYISGLGLEVRDMIESPHNPGDLIVVGIAAPDSTQYPYEDRAIDGFFLDLSTSTGAVQIFKTYSDDPNFASSCNWFTAIAPAYSTYGGNKGYLIGGLSDPIYNSPIYTPSWMLKLDPGGSVIWSTLITDHVGYQVSSVLERQSPVTGNYECYGVTAHGATGTGVAVIKLDDAGTLVSGNNFFDYTGYTPMSAASHKTVFLTCINNGSLDDGLQVYGTDAGGYDDYFVKAYFDGHSGCNENITTTIQNAGPQDVISPPILTHNGPIQGSCPNFEIITPHPVISSEVITNFCSATSIGGASNARSATTGISKEANEENVLHIQPNPTSGKTTIMFENGRVKIDLYNCIGQFIKTIYTSEGGSQQHSVELDFNNLNLESGIYFVHSTVNSITTKHKVIYTK